MVESLYKVIFEVLAGRLKYNMGIVSSDSLIGFTKHRNIADGLITANTTLHWLEKKRRQAAQFKINFGEAYGSVK